MTKQITLLDGAVGTSLWERSDDRNPVWTYNLTKPDIVIQQAKDFMEVGAKVILTNSFGANGPAVKASSDMNVEEVVSKSVRLTKQALAEKKAEDGSGKYDDVKIALAFGPLSQMLEPWGELSYDDCRKTYEQIISAGMAEKPDIIELMTFLDLDMMKIGVEVAKQYGVPVFASMSFTEFGKTMMGNGVDDILAALEPMGVDAVGLNCSLGPDTALPVIKEFAEKTSLTKLFKPNAGTPITGSDGESILSCNPEQFAEAFIPAFDYADMVGGCCGTNVAYLTAVKKQVDKYLNG